MTELPTAGDRLEGRTVRLEPEVSTTHGHRSRTGPRQVLDLAAIAAGHAVDPAVGPPEQAVEETLNILGAEPREHDLLDVGHAVAGGVLGVEDVGRDGNEDTAIVGHDPRRPGQAVDEDGLRVEPAVSIVVV